MVERTTRLGARSAVVVSRRNREFSFEFTFDEEDKRRKCVSMVKGRWGTAFSFGGGDGGAAVSIKSVDAWRLALSRACLRDVDVEIVMRNLYKCYRHANERSWEFLTRSPCWPRQPCCSPPERRGERSVEQTGVDRRILLHQFRPILEDRRPDQPQHHHQLGGAGEAGENDAARSCANGDAARGSRNAAAGAKQRAEEEEKMHALQKALSHGRKVLRPAPGAETGHARRSDRGSVGSGAQPAARAAIAAGKKFKQ